MSEENDLKYPIPRILLIDLDAQVQANLRQAGFNVISGTFGSPYRVNRQYTHFEVRQNRKLPKEYSDSHVVVLNLTAPQILNESTGDFAHRGVNKGFVFMGGTREVFDPRLYSMWTLKDTFGKILSHGGLFIVFAEHKVVDEIFLGEFVGRNFFEKDSVSVNSWGFLSVLKRINSVNHGGTTITVITEDDKIFWSKYMRDAKFTCHFMLDNTSEALWKTIGVNSYNDPVCMQYGPDDNNGMVFLLPQIATKDQFLIDFLGNILPRIKPNLFPDAEGGQWIDNDVYALPQVVEINREIEETIQEMEKKVTDLEARKAIINEEYSDLYGLLTETDDALVQAVKSVLNRIGFGNVIDVDALRQSQGQSSRDEDLWIDDADPLILIEVKGITTTNITDEDALEVRKYLFPRSQELRRFDIKGLTVVNHQRNLEPLQRTSPFRELQIQNAIDAEIGLLTTWDLFRLANAFIVNGWKHEYIRDIFYQDGLIDPLPSHYTYLGEIAHIWKKADTAGTIGIIPGKDFSVGDKLGIVIPTDFLEQEVASLMVDNQLRDDVKAGEQVGIVLPFTQELKEGYKVYLVTE